MKTTNTILDQIIASKRQRLVIQKKLMAKQEMESAIEQMQPFAGASFYDSLKAATPNPKIIAEFKQASPSKGVLNTNLSLADVSDAYQSAENVVAMSVITEIDHFQGKNDYLSFFAQHNSNHKPLLRKDFIFDNYQILESKLLGAQAFLLIASLFSDEELNDLIAFGLKHNIEPLVEVHTADELSMVTATSARCIGVNSRDLRTFKVDNKAHELLRELDRSYARVAESGIRDAAYLQKIAKFCDAALIGSYFMGSPDIGAAIKKMVDLPVHEGVKQ